MMLLLGVGEQNVERRMHSNFLKKVTGNGFYPFCLNRVRSWLDLRSTLYFKEIV